jgi:hypothetical protein
MVHLTDRLYTCENCFYMLQRQTSHRPDYLRAFTTPTAVIIAAISTGSKESQWKHPLSQENNIQQVIDPFNLGDILPRRTLHPRKQGI